MLVAEHFGIADAKKMLVSDFDKIDLNDLHASISKLPDKDRRLIERAEAITREKKFFHWEIEFPEVFYEKTAAFGQKIDKKTNSGFDCVIGNPPYGVVQEKAFIKAKYQHTSQNLDFYSAFIEHGFELLGKEGRHSFIVPISWQTGNLFYNLRKFLLSESNFISIINLPFDVFKDAYIDTGIFVLQKNVTAKPNSVLIYEFPKYARTEQLDTIEYTTIIQDRWKQNDNRIILNKTAIALTAKINSANVYLVDTVTTSARGVLATPRHISETNKQSFCPFFGGEMLRYEISQPDKFISYDDSLPECPASFDFFTGHRVLVRRLVSRQDRLMAQAVTETFVNKKDIYIFKPTNKLSSNYLLALLNSKLLSYIYFCNDVVAQKDDFRQTTLEGIRKLPIPRISFTTPEKERKEFFKEAIKLYGNSKYGDIIKWVDYEVTLNRTDTVHDFLAYLAEQMIEMNKVKNEEIKGFLKWLEREIGTEIDNLANKTAIKEYHDHDFNHLLDVLKKNKNKLSVDPSNRKIQELLENHFKKGMSVLQPLTDKIKATDNLIDQIIYKLYGLTDGEIEIVEGKEMKDKRGLT